MADYKGIKGFKVQSLASDPTLVEGQVLVQYSRVCFKIPSKCNHMVEWWYSRNCGFIIKVEEQEH